MVRSLTVCPSPSSRPVIWVALVPLLLVPISARL
jgi:hypothetical protein